jgi:hypothetical protein
VVVWRSFMVGAMDGKALAALVNDGVPAFAMPGLEVGQQAPKWEDRATYDLGRHHAFHSMGREKINLINVFITMGYVVMLAHGKFGPGASRGLLHNP